MKKDDQLPGDIPFVMAGITNTGVVNYISNPVAIFPRNSISVDIFGNAFYRDYDFGAGDDTGVYWNDKIKYSKWVMLFFTIAMQKALSGKFSYGKKLRSSQSYNFKMRLPVKDGEIDFAFMENFVAELEARRVAELEAYLLTTGLKDYTLTEEEEKIIRNYENGNVVLSQFLFKDVFNNIKQGRRLKKDNQQKGNIPFVMSGITNTGVVGYISNPIASFPKNSITIDIFGNSFYRNYDFGAGDDTGVYWNNKVNYTKEEMLFFTASMRKSLIGKFSYGKKLRSSQSHNFKMYVIDKNGKPDCESMKLFISAIQKLVIKDVVLYADSKIAETKAVILKQS